MQEPRRTTLEPGWLGSLDPLPWSWVVDRLDKERNFWLVTARTDGHPQARPVWGLWSEGILYLSLGGGGLPRTNNREKQQASAHADSAANVVIIEGTLERTDRDESGTFELGSVDLPALVSLWNAKYEGAWTQERHGFNYVLRPAVVLSWRENAERTSGDASGKWIFD